MDLLIAINPKQAKDVKRKLKEGVQMVTFLEIPTNWTKFIFSNKQNKLDMNVTLTWL